MNNITETQKKLLIILAAVIVMTLTLRLAYFPLMDRALQQESENQVVADSLAAMQNLQSRETEIIEETKRITAGNKGMLAGFSTGNTPEKTIVFLDQLSEACNMDISSISFGTETDVTPGLEDTGIQQATAGGEAASPAGHVTSYHLMNAPVSFTYTASYTGVKNALNYITNNSECITVENFTTGYDPTSGYLTGTMTLNVYAITGGDRKAEEPLIPGIRTGLSDIFGTGHEAGR